MACRMMFHRIRRNRSRREFALETTVTLKSDGGCGRNAYDRRRPVFPTVYCYAYGAATIVSSQLALYVPTRRPKRVPQSNVTAGRDVSDRMAFTLMPERDAGMRSPYFDLIRRLQRCLSIELNMEPPYIPETSFNHETSEAGGPFLRQFRLT